MKRERIAARETSTLFSLIFSVLLIPMVAVASILAAIALLQRLQPMDPSTIMLIFVGIGVAPSAIVSWLMSASRKTTATPLLHIEGTNSTMRDSPIHARVNQTRRMGAREQRPPIGPLRRAASVVLSSAPETTCVKFTVCEEGVVLYRSGHADLVRWGRIRDLKADHESGRFAFTVKRMLGKDSFSAPDRFNEVKQMLSEHIQVR